MPNRLFVDELVSIGLVAAGDNPDATVQIWKAKPEPKVEVKKETTVNPKGVVKVKGNGRAPRTKGVSRMTLPDLTAIEDADLRASIEKSFADLEAEAVNAKAVEDVAKAAQTEIADLKKSLDSEIAKRVETESLQVAKGYEKLLGKPEEIAPVLADIAQKAPEAWAKLQGPLTAAAQRVEMGIFKEIGTSGDGETDPIAKRDAYISKQREAGRTDSEAVLQAEFWKKNPEDLKASRS